MAANSSINQLETIRPRAHASCLVGLTSTDIILLGIGLLPPIAMFVVVIRNWLPLPFGDEWSTPGGTLVAWCEGNLSWQHFFAQHNESRKVFPRLLYLALAQFGGWDVRKVMTLTFLSVCATAVLFWRLMRGLPGATSRGALLTWVAASFLCFSSVQFENYLWGAQLEVFFPGLALLAIAAMNLSRLTIPQKALLNGALALLVTYTVAHGMLLWVLGIPVLARDESFRKFWWIYLAYVVCASLAILAYFVGYQHPAQHPPMFAGKFDPLALAHYLILWAGSYFNSGHVSPFLIGVAAILIFAGALCGVVRLIVRTGEWRSFYPALLISAYACATAAITAAGRVGFGLNQALDSRYRVYSLSFYLAIVALLYSLHCARLRETGQKPKRLFAIACLFLGILGLAGWTSCYVVNFQRLASAHRARLTSLRALRWSSVIPDNPDLLKIFPEPAIMVRTAQILRQNNILRLAFVDEEVGRLVRQIPTAPANQAFGAIEQCAFASKHTLAISGRARLSTPDHRPDCVLIGAIDPNGYFKPLNIMPTTRPPGTGSAHFARHLATNNFPDGDLTIAAWAIDLRAQKIYPLAGTTIIAAADR